MDFESIASANSATPAAFSQMKTQKQIKQLSKVR